MQVLWRKKHLSLDELLLLHSGEIEDSTKPEKHLKECPHCRSALSELDSFLTSVHKTNTQYLEESVARTPVFMPRRWISRKWIGSFVVMTVAAASVLVTWKDSQAQAAEILSKATGAERARRDGYHLVASEGSLSCAMEVPSSQSNQDSYVLVEKADHRSCDLLHSRLKSVGWNWRDPLSPLAFQSWRNGLSDKQDSVSKRDGLVMVTTSTRSHSLTEATLRMTEQTLQPVSARLVIRGLEPLEFTGSPEQQVASLHVNPSSIPATLPPVPRTAEPATATADPLDVAEIRVWLALHALHADQGYETVVRRAGNEIEVRGVTATEERSEAIEKALVNLPLTNAEVWTQAEYAILPNRPQLAFPEIPVTGSGSPLAEERLNQLFPDRSAENQFKNKVMDLTRSLLGHAFTLQALEKLAERTRKVQEARLLADIIQYHQEQLRQVLKNLAVLLTPIAGNPEDTAIKISYEKAQQLSGSLYRLFYRCRPDDLSTLDSELENVRTLLRKDQQIS